MFLFNNTPGGKLHMLIKITEIIFALMEDLK